MKPYAVVILSKSTGNLIPCVNAIREHQPDAPIIWVDDRNEGHPAPALPGVTAVKGIKPFVFSRNVNLGIQAAGDRDVVLLNDDALLQTPLGFDLLALIAGQMRRHRGIVAATCNNVGNLAQIPRKTHQLFRLEARMVCFVCVYIPRYVLNEVGLLDEDFVGYGFEDDDYCKRVRDAGFKISITDHCYVDHESLTSTFRGEANGSVDLSPNHEIYKQKWGEDNRGKKVANIVGMLRIRNEARWIREVIESILPVCSRVVVFDDHSIDATKDIVRQIEKTEVIESPFTDFDEARDKNFLYNHIMQTSKTYPDWLLTIDGDEILDQRDIPELRRLADDPSVVAIRMRILYLWNDRRTLRTDGIFKNFTRPSAFRVIDPSFRFQVTGHGGNLHCNSVPLELENSVTSSGIRLLHLGYLHQSDRLRKYDWYTSKDPDGECYKHLVIGDTLPDHEITRHAGPLKLERL